MASCTCEGKASGRLADLATVVITVTPFPKIISPEVGSGSQNSKIFKNLLLQEVGNFVRIPLPTL